ncbi:sigma factor regulator N-terminal domain-containing protein [Levilactobacillus acidifarinae]|uniref:ECF-type sigma factor negative effector n=1 Tax=Levilactobacillus acidifarinae DSM 19394 = JCM 15949 TaxID=1423715 RepID=A0A0R1LIH4_9LACO|nr:sigma factor regulator N-terminal domain-containing protein [Levilactobacillus acidifarinae]KRK95686.1 hypothetical protein FD25_GL000101 [Levilactobacillus acidifarinae DSM 19394]GEO69423.1 hypothetical protein LAC03_13330 [Levilactobacillus acidifarinae]
MTDEQQFKRLARRLKWRRWVITILIAFVVCVGTLGVGLKIMDTRSRQATAWENNYFDLVGTLLSPNIRVSDQYLTNRTMGSGQLVSHRYKQIEGQRLVWSPLVANYSWLTGPETPSAFNSTDDERNAAYNRVTQQRVPIFYNCRYHPSTQARDYHLAHDLKKVQRTPNRITEMALTFDQPLTYDQIRKRLPRGVHAVWYWLGVPKGADTTTMENNFLGVQASGPQGELTTRDYRYFRQTLVRADRSKIDLNGLFAYGGRYARHYPTPKTAKFAGAIVTGKSDDFRQLGQPQWVAASSVGYFQAVATFK